MKGLLKLFFQENGRDLVLMGICPFLWFLYSFVIEDDAIWDHRLGAIILLVTFFVAPLWFIYIVAGFIKKHWRKQVTEL